MAAPNHKILLSILLISIALFLSAAEAQYSFDDQDGDGSLVVSHISATPEASPAASPGPAVSYVSSAPDASPAEASVSTHSFEASLAVEPSGDSSSAGNSFEASLAVDSSKSAADDSAAAAAAWGAMVNQDMEPISHDVPAAKRSAVNMFVQSTMQVTVAKTDNFIDSVIEKRLQDPETDTFSKDCLQTCKEVYEDSKSAMKKTLEDINEGNYYKANVDVSAMSSDADICKECVKKVYGSDPELDKFNKWVDGVIDQCLTMITGYKA